MIPWICVAAVAMARGQFAGGSGTEDDPYQVATAEQLSAVRDALSASFLQTADIDLDAAPWNEDAGWTPIDTAADPFVGHYDGDGYVVRHLTIDRPAAGEQGLFGRVGPGGRVRRLGVEDAAVTGEDRVGVLVGALEGDVESAYATGTAHGREHVGGLAGWHESGTITASYAAVAVTGDDRLGGLTGRDSTGIAMRSFWDVDASGLGGSGGGKSLTAAQMTSLAVFRDAGWGEDGWAMEEGGSPRLARADLPLPDIPEPAPVALVGSGTAADPYVVDTPEAFALLSWHIGVLDAHLRLTADLDLTGTAIHPVGDLAPFTGVFDGAGHTLRHAALNYPNRNAVGLFGWIGPEGLVLNLGVRQAAVAGRRHVGALAGVVEGSIAGCHVSGGVVGRRSVGGLAGTVSGSIQASYSRASVDGDEIVGGLVGWLLYAAVTDSYAAGPVSGRASVGGLVGDAEDPAVAGSYWDTVRSGQTEASWGAGRTTAEMTHPHATNVYVMWDFAAVWAVDDDFTQNEGYPYLRPSAFTAVRVSVAADPEEAGLVTGGGNVTQGSTVTVKAVAQPGFTFVEWTEGGIGVSTAHAYTFTTEADRDLVAAFVPSVLGVALGAEDLPWATGGDAEWFAQSVVTHETDQAAQSGEITHEQQSWMEATVTGPGRLGFWWKVSSEDGWDWLVFQINGEAADGISGEEDWAHKTFDIPPGEHTLRWVYFKDEVDLDPVGEDAGWVAQVTWEQQRLLTVRSENPDTGVAIDGTYPGETEYEEIVSDGDVVSLTASAFHGEGADRMRFSHWTGAVESAERTIVLAMDEDRDVTAHYVPYDPPDLHITAPTDGAPYESPEAELDLAGTVADGVNVVRVAIRNSRDVREFEATGTAEWSFTGLPLHQGLNVIDITAYDEDGTRTTKTIEVTYEGDALYDGGLRSGQVVQLIDFPDEVPRGHTVRVRWQVLSYVPVRSYLQTAHRVEGDTVWIVRRNGVFVGETESAWNIGGGAKHARVYSFEADWTAPDSGPDPVDIYAWINVAQTDGTRYMMASIPDGVDPRPDAGIAKVFRRTIVPEADPDSPGAPDGLALDEEPYRDDASRQFDTLDPIRRRSGGTVTWLDVPDDWVPGANVTCRWRVLTYMDIESQVAVADFANAVIPIEVVGTRTAAVVTPFHFTHGGQTYYATEYTFQATFTVPPEWAETPPGEPGAPRVQVFFRHRIRNTAGTRMACNMDAGIDARPFEADGMFGRFIERAIDAGDAP